MLTLRFGLEKVEIDARGMRDSIEHDRAFGMYAAQEWRKMIEPYVPFETGKLQQKVTVEPWEFTYNAPYAHYMYEGDVYGPNYPLTQNGVQVGFFSTPNRPKSKTGARIKYKNPQASAHWDEAAAPTQLPKLVSSLQAYVDSGRLKIDG